MHRRENSPIYKLYIDEWNISRRTQNSKNNPIHKKGQSDDVNNYRPISMLNHFSKIVEKIIKTRLVNFIKKHYGFDSQQYGFQVHSNTLGATVDLLDK